LKNAINAYKKPLFETPALFDKVLTIEGNTVDTKEYRQNLNKTQQETLKKPIIDSTFSRIMDARI
jgi:hypothetical protein